MLQGFRAFILRGNVIDLAVAVVIGTAFTAIVNGLVTGIFNPLISLLFNSSNLAKAESPCGPPRPDRTPWCCRGVR